MLRYSEEMSSGDESSIFNIYDDGMECSPSPVRNSDGNQAGELLECNTTASRMSLGWYNGNQATISGNSQHVSSAAPLSKRRRSSKQECFIEKLYKMATCDGHASVFGFSDDGTYIEIRTPSGLAHVLNQYFKHSNTSSFIRQLNNYGFKTMSSISTSKAIQCFCHPQFRRGAPEDLVRITRKTARILKKCKREIIKDLQTSDAACRKRVSELQQLHARLEEQIARLECDNARLLKDVSGRDGLLQGSPASDMQPLPNRSSSALASTMPSRILSPLQHRAPDRRYAGNSSSTTSLWSLETSESSPSLSSGRESSVYLSSARSSLTSLDSYYIEPMLEIVSDYSEESPLVSIPQLQLGISHLHPNQLTFQDDTENASGLEGAHCMLLDD